MMNEELKIKNKNVLKDRSFVFSIHIVEQYKRLTGSKEFVMSKQLLRSGTAIGALIREAEFAQSKADFISKLSIALKEANETFYWLELLHRTHYIDAEYFEDSSRRTHELISMLVASIKTSKLKLNK
ncbi:four helix bundle protein [Chryseobacterium sp. 22532]|jgi:four helix bundle protein|uniref:four helix bundle protein n=1 Tax=Chryseobacterium sp. 22532 TaxID=3453938 RepID=UPI003F869E9E